MHLVFFASLLLKGTLLLAIATAFTLILHCASAASRHLVWLLTMAALLVLPTATLLLPAWRILPANQTTSHVDSPTLANILPTHPLAPLIEKVVPADLPLSAPARPLRQVSPHQIARDQSAHLNAPRDPVALALVAVYIVGLTLSLAPTVIAPFFLRRLRKASTAVRDAATLDLLHQTAAALRIRSSIQLLRSHTNTIPMTFGIFRSSILVPADVLSWPVSRWHAVLLHECAHIRRRDIAALLLSRIARALWWFHPLAWHAHTQLAAEAEKSCDDLVLTHGISPTTYAKELVLMANIFRKGTTMGAVSMARQSTLETRVHSVLDTSRERSTIALPGKLAAIAFAALIAPYAVLTQATAQTAASPSIALTATSATSQPAPWIKQLSDGSRIEFLFLGLPNNNGLIWRPDGTPLVEPTSRLDWSTAGTAAIFRVTNTDHPPEEIVGKIRGYTTPFDLSKRVTEMHLEPIPRSDVNAQMQARRSGLGDMMKVQNVPNMYAMGRVDTDSSVVSVGCGIGEWKTVYEGVKGDEGRVEQGSFAISEADPRSQVKVNCSFKEDEVELRMIAIAKDGTTQPLESSQRESAGALTLWLFGRGSTWPQEFVPLTYRLQIRSVEWVTFRNVHTQPGDKLPEPPKPVYRGFPNDPDQPRFERAGQVYVMGAVDHPGAVNKPYGKMTLLQAVASTGLGDAVLNSDSSAVVITRDIDGKRVSSMVPLNALLSGARGDEVWADDVVRVEKQNEQLSSKRNEKDLKKIEGALKLDQTVIQQLQARRDAQLHAATVPTTHPAN